MNILDSQYWISFSLQINFKSNTFIFLKFRVFSLILNEQNINHDLVHESVRLFEKVLNPGHQKYIV